MELNLSTTIICNSKTKDNWQMVYTSQLYGTFFAVYAKINADGDKKHISNIDLKLINYKGPINLEIHSAKYNSIRNTVNITDPICGHKMNINVVSISLWVRGLSNDDTSLSHIPISCDLGNELMYLEINRKLLPLCKDGNHLVHGVFDSEYFYRDGLSTPLKKDISKIEGLYTWDDFNCPDNENNKSEEVENFGPGGICPRGYGKIIF